MTKPKYSIKHNMIYLTKENPSYNDRYRYKQCILFDSTVFLLLSEVSVSTVIGFYRSKHNKKSLKAKLLFKMVDDEVIDHLIKIKIQYNSNIHNIISIFSINDILTVLGGNEVWVSQSIQ